MTPEQAKALREPFPKSAIGYLPKGGVQLAYVGHAATTDRLLQVDPAWTWEPLGVDEQGLPAMDAAGNLWIRLTVAGVTRIGVGDGKSQKERIGDAIRNAAMRFGVALDLWAKEDLQATQTGGGADTTEAPEGSTAPSSRTGGGPATAQGAVQEGTPGPSSPRPVSPEQITKLQTCFGKLGFTDRESKLAYSIAVIGRDIATSKNLSSAEAHRVIEALEADLRETEEPPV